MLRFLAGTALIAVVIALGFGSARAQIVTQTVTVNISFTDNADNEAGFNLYQCVGVACTPTNKILSPIAPSTGVGTIVKVADNIANDPGGRTICYNVSAFNTAGESPRSNTACIVTPVIIKVPSSPSGLIGVVVGTKIP